MEFIAGKNLVLFLAILLFLINAYIIRKGNVHIQDFQYLNLGVKVFGTLLLIIAAIIPFVEIMHMIFSFILTQIVYLMCYTLCLLKGVD
ncbi:hypothetical protein [Tannockella kyphosi]|uniref:hypothetical protein n=1 Tax=Tannockella kyphosi TaxID=2899121 RepID=UPI0020134047|nr:hypothetical protein [Tannockella kyphosi]